MTEDIQMDHWHPATHHRTTIRKTQSMDSDDWWHTTEDPHKSKRDQGAARPTKSCWLHNPNGPPFPWLTMQGTISCETQMVYHMECITTGQPWIVEKFPWLGEQWLQPRNQLTFQPPSHIECSDACKQGIGGFLATTGIAWHWEIPGELCNQATLNVLEYLAGYISIWIKIQMENTKTGLCFLSQTALLQQVGSKNQTLEMSIPCICRLHEQQLHWWWTMTPQSIASGSKETPMKLPMPCHTISTCWTNNYSTFFFL